MFLPKFCIQNKFTKSDVRASFMSSGLQKVVIWLIINISSDFIMLCYILRHVLGFPLNVPLFSSLKCFSRDDIITASLQ